MTWTVPRWAALLRGYVFLGMVALLCGFTSTTLIPERAEVVTSDVEHFWQAFDDAAKVVPHDERLPEQGARLRAADALAIMSL